MKKNILVALGLLLLGSYFWIQAKESRPIQKDAYLANWQTNLWRERR